MIYKLSEEQLNKLSYIHQSIEGLITVKELAEKIYTSERQAWRLKRKVSEMGPEGILHGNSGRTPHNKLNKNLEYQIVQVFNDWRENTDEGINASHLCDILQRRHNIVISRKTCWKVLKSRGLILNARKVKKHRTRRERRKREGEILFLDGSPHYWLGKDQHRCTLILCIDDATSKALGGTFVKEENRNSCFEVAYRVFSQYGLPHSFWLDRGSQFITTRGEGLLYTQTPRPTQWQNAMYNLGIQLIFASSPQARGRGERANLTFQKRLAAELQYFKIQNMKEATDYLQNIFIPDYNECFSVPASEKSIWRKAPDNYKLLTTLAARQERKVLNDNTVKNNGIRYQLLKRKGVSTFARNLVEVQEWYDGSFHIIHPRYGDLKYTSQREYNERRVCMP